MSPIKSLVHGIARMVPFCPPFDRLWAAVWFIHRTRRLPRRFLYNDLLFWMRWNGGLLDPLRQFTTDKVLVKDFVRARLGEEYVVKTLAVLETRQQIYDYVFPERCVIKPAHGCGEVIFCTDGAVDRELLVSWLEHNNYRGSREQNYAFLRPRIVVEEFALGAETIPDDYKVFCVHGVPKAIWAMHDRFAHQHDGISGEFYDVDWVVQPIWTKAVRQGPPRPRPATLDKMLAAAAALSSDFPLVRIDLYSDGSAVKVGEITHCPAGAGTRYKPENGEALFSSLLFGEAGQTA